MQKRSILLPRWVKIGLISLTIGYLFCTTSLSAQIVKQTYVSSDDQHYYDIRIPDKTTYLILEVRGADGGVSTGFDNVAPQNAGQGALVSGFLKIGTGSGEVTPGSTLRIIPGQKGGGATYFGGGGGGSAAAFKAPGTSAEWQLLLVAGGGGGAGTLREGKAGTAYLYGLSGARSDGVSLHNEGENGNGGSRSANQAYPGGGALSSGGGGCPGKAGFHDKVPTGAQGGKTDCGTDANDITAGGFGFGGGGSGIGNHNTYPYQGGGGGGGGYSGGGGGRTIGDEHFGGPGGGGGSYADPDWVHQPFYKSFGVTRDPQDGYVSYSFLQPGPVFLAKDQSKCLDLPGNGASSGTNIQLYSYNDTEAQQWVYHNLAIRLNSDISKCLDLDHSNTANGANIQLYDCNETNAQRWVYNGFTGVFHSVLNLDKCLDVNRGQTADGTNIQLWDCNGGGAQKWIPVAQQPAMPAGTDKRIHLLSDSGQCVDIFAGRAVNGSNIQLWHQQDNNDSQYFTFEGRNIKMQAAPNKCLDVDHSNTANGTNIQLWDCNGTNAQVWIYNGITKTFHSGVDLSKCLSGADTADGANIQLWDCNDSRVQQFEIY